MKKLFIMGMIFVILTFMVSCNQQSTLKEKQANVNTDYIGLLNNAKTIKIKESIISFGKHYTIYADGKKVAEVKGKLINAFGDTFQMKDENGRLLGEENQVKRWGMKFTREAIVKDKDGNIIGYIAEETRTKIFSIGYFFHFFDKNKKEIGVSDQVNFSLLKQNNFYDGKGNVDYHVNEKFSIIGDTYEMTIKDNKNIPVMQAVFMTCIEDAIKDAKEKQKQKQKSKKH